MELWMVVLSTFYFGEMLQMWGASKVGPWRYNSSRFEVPDVYWTEKRVW